jgi:hypothetical protein
MIVERILALKAIQDEKGPSLSISSLLRYGTCLQYDLACLQEKRDKLKEQASWFTNVSSSSSPVAASNNTEHFSFVPNRLQKQLVSLEKYIDDKQEEILQTDRDLNRAVMLECLLPDGTDFLTSHSYFNRTAEIKEQPSPEERMGYITELYHHLMSGRANLHVA